MSKGNGIVWKWYRRYRVSEGTGLTLNGRDNDFIQSFQSCSLLHRSDFHAHWAGVGGCRTKANTYFDESRVKSSSKLLSPSARYGDKSTSPSCVILNARLAMSRKTNQRLTRRGGESGSSYCFPAMSDNRMPPDWGHDGWCDETNSRHFRSFLLATTCNAVSVAS